jgi:hypothetical protein
MVGQRIHARIRNKSVNFIVFGSDNPEECPFDDGAEA